MTAASAQRQSFQVGDKAILTVGGKGKILVVSDVENIKLLLGMLHRDDRKGLDLLVSAQKAIPAEDGTEVRVLEVAQSAIRVLITCGEKGGCSGWVPQGWVR